MKKVWTGAEDILIFTSLNRGIPIKDIAASLGCSYDQLYSHIYVKGWKEVKPRPKWSAKEDELLEHCTSEGIRYGTIASKVDRSYRGVAHRAAILGTNFERIGYSKAGVAKLFGIGGHKAIDHLVSIGVLNAHKLKNRPTARNSYVIFHDDIIEFIDNERTWHWWDASKITDSGLREYAQEVRDGKHWLTTVDLGKIFGYTSASIWLFIRNGLLRATLVGGRRWCMRADWLPRERERLANRGPKWWIEHPEWVDSY